MIMTTLMPMLLLAAPHDHHHGGHHGNPEDVDGYIARMEAPDRAAWQKPDEVLSAIGIAPGQIWCDIGAGPGYFSLRIAKKVAPGGHDFAVDVEPKMTAALRDRLQKGGVRNVTPVLALEDDPLIPEKACDVILVVDTFHHFPDGVTYLRRLARSLKPGGKLVNIDFHKRELPVGPPVEHKIARDAFVAQAQEAGLAVVNEPTFLPYQYFVVLQPKP